MTTELSRPTLKTLNSKTKRPTTKWILSCDLFLVLILFKRYNLYIQGSGSLNYLLPSISIYFTADIRHVFAIIILEIKVSIPFFLETRHSRFKFQDMLRNVCKHQTVLSS
jgi:hypothetical protein